MHSVRILHTADWHLGKENTYLGAMKDARKYEIPVTVKRAVMLCEEENVDVMLIAGDLFDSNRIEDSIINEILEIFGQLTRTKVVIALGNHDPLTADSPFKNKKLSANTFVLPENDSVLEFDNCRIYGSSFGSVYKTGSERFFITPENDDKVNILLLHGETKADLSSAYRSITKTFIEESGMDYVALGHNHKRSEIARLGSSYFAYSGCIEGQGYDEDGEKGVYLGNITKNSADLKFVPLAKRTHYLLDVDISEETDEAKAIKDAIKNVCDNPIDNLFRVTLKGNLEAKRIVNLNDIYAKVSPEVYHLKLKDRTGIKADLELLSKENSLKGKFVSEMLIRIKEANETERETYINALRIGLKSFDGQVNYGED